MRTVIQNRIRVLLGLCILGMLLTLGIFAMPIAYAAPKTIGGTFTVNATGDLNSANSFLALREAILLANGGTGGDGISTGLGRALSASEEAQLAGCTISSGLITGGCGAGITDTIVFNLSVGVTITLGATSIPVINDTAPTIVDGTAVSPTIDASGVIGSHNGLHISSNNNVIKSIGIANTSLSDFYVAGNSNLLESVWAWNAGVNGIYIVGNSNVMTHTLIGVSSFVASSCGTNYGNAGSGIYVTGALSNVIEYSFIGCNAGDGITLDNFAHGTTVIANAVGESGCCSGLSNNGNGLQITGGAHDNVIGSLSDAFDGTNSFVTNGLDGVAISGTNTATNTLISNYTSSNSANGVRITQGAYNNVLAQGGPSVPVSTLNGQNGILIAASAHDNMVFSQNVFSNARNGIELSGAGTTGNVILGGSYGINTRDGINERNSADNNKWTQISTNDNGGLGIDKNAGNDANDNITPPFPVITSVSCGGGNCTVSGTASLPGTGTTVVEVYAVATDPIGYGEGKTFLGSVSANSGGSWSTSVSSISGTCFTAFQTQTTSGGVSTSSEFGPNSCRLFLPLILK